MSPKRTPEKRPKKKATKEGTGADGPDNTVVFPQQYMERLKRGSAENIARLPAAKQQAVKSIDRDLEALNRNDHGLDPEVVDEFVTLLKTARRELAQSDRLSIERAAYLRATGKRLEALVEKVKLGIKPGPSE